MTTRKHIKPFLIIALAFLLILSGCSGGSKATESTSSASDLPIVTPSAEAAIEAPETAAKSEDSVDSDSLAEGSTTGGDSAAETEVPTGSDTMGERPEPSSQPKPQSGILTAGEWNDNEEFSFLLDLMQRNSSYNEYSSQWRINVSRRIVAKVTDGRNPIANAEVKLISDTKEVVWTAKTNNQGIAYLFNGVGESPAGALAYVRATVNGEEKELGVENPSVVQEFKFQNQTTPAKSLDLSLVIDTTGSMGDELSYLKSELKGVVERVSQDNANIPIRTAVSVYRDQGDSYVVRHNYLNDNISDTLSFIKKQKADGGGDWEEALEEALESAINDQTWNKDATARIILLVLDAPPHNTADIRLKMETLMADAASKGVVIIPIASSGIDKTTEFLLRSLSVSTGGTYTFLTDHSGVGNSHIEPTIGQYQVEYLDDLLVRVINERLK